MELELGIAAEMVQKMGQGSGKTKGQDMYGQRKQSVMQVYRWLHKSVSLSAPRLELAVPDRGIQYRDFRREEIRAEEEKRLDLGLRPGRCVTFKEST